MTLNLFHGIDLLQCTLPPKKTSSNLWFSEEFQEVYKNTSAMKWVKYIFNKNVIVLIFMLVP